MMGPGVCSDPLIHPGSAQRKLFSNECHSTSHREAEGMQEREAKMCLWAPIPARMAPPTWASPAQTARAQGPAPAARADRPLLPLCEYKTTFSGHALPH